MVLDLRLGQYENFTLRKAILAREAESSQINVVGGYMVCSSRNLGSNRRVSERSMGFARQKRAAEYLVTPKLETGGTAWEALRLAPAGAGLYPDLFARNIYRIAQLCHSTFEISLY